MDQRAAWSHVHLEIFFRGPRSGCGRSSIVPNGGCAERWKIGYVPAASQCLDQEHTRVQPTPQDINGVSLVGKFDRLRGDDLEIRVDTTFVTIREKLKRF